MKRKALCEEQVVVYLNNVLRLDKLEYVEARNGIRIRKKFIPTIEEASDYDNLGKEVIRRIEEESDKANKNSKRTNYFALKKRYQEPYMTILGIPYNLMEKVRFENNEIVQDIDNRFIKNIAELPISKLPEVVKFCQIQLEYLAKVLWFNFNEIENEKEFKNILRNRIKYILEKNYNGRLNIEAVINDLSEQRILFVFNNCESIKEFNSYKKIRKIMKNGNNGGCFHLKLIEISTRKKSDEKI